MIYYGGAFPPYKPIAESLAKDQEKALPIYVGKAVPEGSRKGGYGLGIDPGQVLFRRLCEHAASIQGATNLHLTDFQCRYLLVDDIWIPLGEALLIEKFQPVWNLIVDGFGHHNQGKARRGQMKSAWDTMHPGREWAGQVELANPRTADQIAAEVTTFLHKLLSN